MRTENGIRRILQIPQRIVPCCLYHCLRILTGSVASEDKGQIPPASGVACHLDLVAVHPCRRRPPGEHGTLANRLRRMKFSLHPLDIRQRPPQVLGGQFQPEVIVRLQKHTLCLHQTLAHRPVSSLPEVASFRVLQMGFPCSQGDLHIGKLRSRKHAPVPLLFQMGKDQPLPVAVQHILAAVRGIDHSAAPLPRLQHQMDFRVMPQRFIMSHSLHRIADGLLVDHTPRPEGHFHTKALPDQFLQDLNLHLSHHLGMQFSQLLLPHDPKQGIFFFQLPQISHGSCDLPPFRQEDLITQHRLQHGRSRRRLFAQALPWKCMSKPGDRADHPGLRLLNQFILVPGINPDLIHLLPVGSQHVFHPQLPAGDLQMGQPVSLAVPGDLVHPGAKPGIPA